MSDLTVLVPLDGTKPAELALTFLKALQPLEPRVRLLSVVDAGEDAAAEEEKRLLKLSSTYLEETATRLQERLGMEFECVQRTGRAHAEILEEAARQDVDVIVMTTHGRTSYDLERLGSVTDKVVRGASCPTLLIGPHAAVPTQIDLITVPLDGSRLAAEALPVAKAFAEKLGSRLRLVQAVQYPPAERETVGALAFDVIGSLELTASLYLSEAKLELETSQPVETAVLSGEPAQALLLDLKENRPDLVIMTSHGRTGFIRWALGSVTDRIIRGPVPVLVLRPTAEVGQRLRALLQR